MNTEENIKYVTARYPDAYMRKYAALSMVIWCPLLKCRLSGFFHTGDEAWADSVEFIDRLKNRKKPMTTQLPNGYEAVKVPEGAFPFEIYTHAEQSELYYFQMSGDSDFTPLPTGNYCLLGRADELTEEQCREIVGTMVFDEPNEYWGQITVKAYIDYEWLNNDTAEWTDGFPTALESFRSLLASLRRYPLGSFPGAWGKTEGIIEEEFIIESGCAWVNRRALPPPFAEKPEDLFKVAMDNDWSAKKIIAYILENYTLVKR